MNRLISRTVRTALPLVWLLALGWAPMLTADPIPVFGPQSYERTTGPPRAVVSSFEVHNPDAVYTLNVYNGGREGDSQQGHRVSSGVIRVNGTIVVAPDHLNQRVDTLNLTVHVRPTNEISVELRGRPGGVVTIEIVRAPVEAEIGPAGGVLADPGGEWEMTVPEGALATVEMVTITQGVTPAGSVPEIYALVGDAFRFEPDGLIFAKPVLLRFRYPQGALPENGLEERLAGFYVVHDDSTVTEMKADFDHVKNEARVELPHFSFGVILRVLADRVADGTTTNPVLVELVAQRVADELSNPPAGQTVEEYFAAHAALLEPFLDAVEEVLGAEFVAETFPPEVVAVAPPDVCDGLDNDGDGEVDEGFLSETTTCGVGLCGATGATSCVSGAIVDSCSPGGCSDANQCTEDLCDPATGACSFQPADGLPCGDGLACHAGECRAVAGCGDLSGLQTDAPWPMFGACPTHQGRSRFLGAQTPTVKWQAKVGFPRLSSKLARFVSSPAVARNNTVYVGSSFWVAAVDGSGAVQWSRPPSGEITKGSGMLSTVAIAADGTLYTGSQDGHLYAIAPDGSEIWRFATSGPVISSAVVTANGAVYVGATGDPGGLLAVNPDGTLEWRFNAGSVSSSPAIGPDGTIFVGTADGHLYAVNPDGSLRWAFTTGGAVVSSPAVGEDGAVYVGSFFDGRLYAVNPDGTQRWVFETGDRISSSPTFGKQGTLYITTVGGRLYAVNPDGSSAWSLLFSGQGSSAAVGSDGTIYFGWWSGVKCKKSKTLPSCSGLAAVNSDGAVKWSVPLTVSAAMSAPTIANDGTVYVNADGVLFAIGGDARGGEICSNQADDDGDGLADCVDPDCDGLVCSDGDACTTLDVCSAGLCVGDRPASCEDGNPCTADSCDPVLGCVSTAVADGIVCTDDLDLCTEDLCLSGLCTHPTIPEDCAQFECGPSPSGCHDCGSCAAGFECDPLGQCVSNLPLELALVSKDSAGVPGNAESWAPVLSADGRFAAFWSFASNLVPNDTNLAPDVFVHDRLTGETARVSVGSAGLEGDAPSSNPALSADGRFVAFDSLASTLTPGDTNGRVDVFVHDRLSAETSRISLGSTGIQGNGDSTNPSLSADGRFVAFSARASNLVPNDTNGSEDVFVHDRLSGETTRVSIRSSGLQAHGLSAVTSLSADGRFVAFQSSAPDLVTDDTNRMIDVFVHDRLTGETSRVSVDSSGLESDGDSFNPSLSADGRFIAFQSDAANLVPGDTNGTADVFVHDRLTGATTRASVDPTGLQGNGHSVLPALSGDGRVVTFGSSASNLVPGDTGLDDVFVRDRLTGAVARVSEDAAGVGGNSASQFPALSTDGRFVAFQSYATNLVPGVSPYVRDVFVTANPFYGVVEENCGDDLDGDGDGLADCLDPDCGDEPKCLGIEADCGNGFDDDGDGLADCADPDCGDDPECLETSCDNGFDDNSNGAIDCTDATCCGRRCGTGRTCIGGVCSIIGCADVSGLQAGAPWPMRGFCPTHRGRGLTSGATTPQLRWTFPADVSVDISSPAIAADGTTYLPSRDGFLYAVDIDGNELWRFSAADQMLSSPAIAADGTVYVGSADGNLYALTPDGTERWRFSTAAPVVSSPVIAADGTIYFGSDDGHLYALSPDGAELWSFPTGAGVASSPTIGPDGTVYVGSHDGNLYALSSDGSELWRFPADARVSSPSIGADGTIYIGSFDGHLYAIRPDGTELWRFLTGGPVISSPSLGADGTVYIGSDDGRLWAIGTAGTLRWSFATGAEIKSTPAIGADETIYVTSFDGNLYALAPDGSEVWRYATSGRLLSSPALGSDGTICFGTDLGNVFTLGTAF